MRDTRPVRPEEISVVVQGGVHPEYTPQCLRSVRTALPGAFLLLSTWEGTDCRGLDCDELVQSRDPGAVYSDMENRVLNNFDRQLVSTRAGLMRVRTPYCMKLRSDMLLLDASFLRFFGRYDAVPPPYLGNRILILDFYTRNPRILPVPFHPSDWLAFGRTEDLRRYYDIPLQPEEERRWFASHRKESACFPTLLMRYAAEQYFCLGFLRARENIRCENYYDASPENIRRTERFFAENLVVLDYGRQMNVRFLKRRPNYLGDKPNLLHHRDWQMLYRRYCRGKVSSDWRAYLFRCRARRFVFVTLRRHALDFLDRMGLRTELRRLCEKMGRVQP